MCSNCGAEIEVLDFSVSVIQSPMKGEVCVPCDSDFIRELLHSLISELHGVYHDNFLVDESLGCINIKCDDIAGGRLVLRLNEELSKRGGMNCARFHGCASRDGLKLKSARLTDLYF